MAGLGPGDGRVDGHRDGAEARGLRAPPVVNYDLGPKPPASSGGCRTIRDGTWRVVASHRLGRLAWFFPTRRKDGITPHRASRRIASSLVVGDDAPVLPIISTKDRSL